MNSNPMPQDLDQASRHETVLDVTVEQVARVYAQAFLAAANKAGRAAELVEELESPVHDVLDQFPRLEETLGSALVSHEEREGIIDRILGSQASPLMVNFLKVLSAHGRLYAVRSVARLVHQLYNKESGRVEVELRVAYPLDGALEDEVTAALRSALSAEPELHVRVDPALIAGFIVRVGDTVFDGSVRTRFERARRAMVERAIERIETRPESFLE
jgi:F-type H+-transporting ATPase subunit delta